MWMRRFILAGAAFAAIVAWSALQAESPFVAVHPEATLHTGAGDESPRRLSASMSADGVISVSATMNESARIFTSRDGGRTFSSAENPLPCPKIDHSLDRGLEILRTGKSVLCSAVVASKNRKNGFDLYLHRSTDDGKTWSEPVVVNDPAGRPDEGRLALSIAKNDDVWCVWLDDRDIVYPETKTRKGVVLCASVSRDDGRTWSQNLVLARPGGGRVEEWTTPTMAPMGAAGVGVLFRAFVDGSTDMYLAENPDGKAFLPARRLGTRRWNVDHRLMDGGGVVSGPAGWTAAYTCKDFELYAAEDASPRERRLGRGEARLAACVPSSQGPIFSWLEEPSAIFLQIGLDGAPKKLVRSDRRAVVASHSGRNRIVLIWSTPTLTSQEPAELKAQAFDVSALRKR